MTEENRNQTSSAGRRFARRLFQKQTMPGEYIIPESRAVAREALMFPRPAVVDFDDFDESRVCAVSRAPGRE
jgi:hypothetical protein